MEAADLINAWGAAKYGRPGNYTLSIQQGGYCYSTMTQDSYPEVVVACNGETVESMESPNFAELLNEILGAQP